jgi:hypothetical protein
VLATAYVGDVPDIWIQCKNRFDCGAETLGEVRQGLGRVQLPSHARQRVMTRECTLRPSTLT